MEMQNKSYVFLCMAMLLLFSNFFTVYAEKDRMAMATKCLMLCYQAKNLYVDLDKFVLPKEGKYQSLTPLYSAVGGSECFGYILEMPKKIYLVFRGTESYSDLFKDFMLWKKSFTYLPNGGKVHSGFLSIYDGTSQQQSISLREQIFTILKKLNPEKRLIITGFSLGGAIATLCAGDIVENSPFKEPDVYTFASPRVGNQQFVDSFNQRVRESVRVVNYHDYVPCNPMQWLGYRHVKGEVLLRVSTGRIDLNHRIFNAYFPGLAASVPEYVENKLKKKDKELCPPLPHTLPAPSWEDKESGNSSPQPPNNEEKGEEEFQEIS